MSFRIKLTKEQIEGTLRLLFFERLISLFGVLWWSGVLYTVRSYEVTSQVMDYFKMEWTLISWLGLSTFIYFWTKPKEVE